MELNFTSKTILEFSATRGDKSDPPEELVNAMLTHLTSSSLHPFPTDSLGIQQPLSFHC
jgi:hypothetical protein